MKMRSLDELKGQMKLIYRERFKKDGMPKVLGDVIVECLFSEKPLTLQELSERTGYSLANLSLALKTKIGILKVFTLPKSKRKYVDVNFSIQGLIVNELKDLIDDFLPKVIFVLNESLKSVKELNESSKILHKLYSFKREATNLRSKLKKVLKIMGDKDEYE